MKILIRILVAILALTGAALAIAYALSENGTRYISLDREVM